MKTYADLVEQLVDQAPASGYAEVHQLPDLSISDLVIVIRHAPVLLARLNLDPAAVTQALECSGPDRTNTRLAIQLHSAIEAAVRNYMFADVVKQSAGRARVLA